MLFHGVCRDRGPPAGASQTADCLFRCRRCQRILLMNRCQYLEEHRHPSSSIHIQVVISCVGHLSLTARGGEGTFIYTSTRVGERERHRGILCGTTSGVHNCTTDRRDLPPYLLASTVGRLSGTAFGDRVRAVVSRAFAALCIGHNASCCRCHDKSRSPLEETSNKMRVWLLAAAAAAAIYCRH